jgi:integrase
MPRKISPQNDHGKIRLRWSHKGKRYSLAPVPGGEFGNAQDMRRAETVAALISADIAMGSFDLTLARYGGGLREAQRGIDDAQERLKELRQQRGQADLREIWEKYRDFKAPQLAPTTLKIDYGRRMAIWGHLESTRLSEAVAIRDWIVAHKSPAQAKKILQNLNAACEWAGKSELIETNPFKGMAGEIGGKHDEDEINPFTPGERDRIIAAFQADPFYSHYAPLVQFIFFTGCRPSEAIAIQWGDLRGDKLTLQRTFSDGEMGQRLKTQKKRTIALNQKAIAAVKTSKANPNGVDQASHFIFASPHGLVVDWHNFANRGWRHILAGLPEIEYRNPKQMRHTFLTERVLAGDSPADLARYCGNSPGTIYKHYLGASRDYSPG